MLGKNTVGQVADMGRKAATIITALGTEKASKVYKYLNESDVRLLTVEVSKLGHTKVEESDVILNEFYRSCLTRKVVNDGGVEYARAILEKAFGEKDAAVLLEKVSKYLKNKSFSFMNGLDGRNIRMILKGERPQTIALVLSYVEPETAATTLVEMEPELRCKVIECISNMESASPEVVQLVEEELYKKLEGVFHTGYTQVGGLDYTADIMNHMDRSNEKSIFDEMNKSQPELVEEIRKRMFVFEDVVGMEDRSIQRFLRDCDTKAIVYALKGSSEELREVIFRNMSSRVAETVRDDLELLHDVRVKDVESAQSVIVTLIRSLDEQGELVINKFGKGDVIA